MAEETNFPFEIQDLDAERTAKCKDNHETPPPGYVLVGPEKYFYLCGYKEEGPKIYNLKVRPTDTFVVTFPKSGTTWVQELVWLLMNDFDYDKAKSINLTQRFPFIDMGIIFDEPTVEAFSSDEKLSQLVASMKNGFCDGLEKVPTSTKRFIKSHLPLSLLPPKMLDIAKVIYVARDPRDVIVSYFHHVKFMQITGYKKDFKTFWQFFLDGLFDWAPYFPHLKEAWAKRHHPNMLFLFYEGLIKDLPACVRRVSKFLGKTVTDEEMVRICDHLSFENFKKNPSVNFEELREFGVLSPNQFFVRKGKVGGWRDYFDEEMIAQTQRWIEDNLRGSDLRFPTLPEEKK